MFRKLSLSNIHSKLKTVLFLVTSVMLSCLGKTVIGHCFQNDEEGLKDLQQIKQLFDLLPGYKRQTLSEKDCLFRQQTTNTITKHISFTVLIDADINEEIQNNDNGVVDMNIIHYVIMVMNNLHIWCKNVTVTCGEKIKQNEMEINTEYIRIFQ